MQQFIDSLPPYIRLRVEKYSCVLDKLLTQDNKLCQALARIETKTTCDRKIVFLASIFLFFLYVTIGSGAKFVIDVATFLPSAYLTLAAFSPVSSLERLMHWSVYWMLFCLIGIVEMSAFSISAFIPFYFPLKFILLLYLYHPYTFGVAKFYRSYLSPLWLKYESKVHKIVADFNLFPAPSTPTSNASEIVADSKASKFE